MDKILNAYHCENPAAAGFSQMCVPVYLGDPEMLSSLEIFLLIMVRPLGTACHTLIASHLFSPDCCDLVGSRPFEACWACAFFFPLGSGVPQVCAVCLDLQQLCPFHLLAMQFLMQRFHSHMCFYSYPACLPLSL